MSIMTVRMDEVSEAALAYLQEQTKTSRSEAIRSAILEAERRTRRTALRAEATTLMDDPDDRAEAQAVLAFMGGSDAW